MTVAVLGAGYAGVTAARRLEGALPESTDLVLVNDSPEHLVRHEVHRVIRRPDFASEIRVDLADLLDRATVRVDRVTDVDPEAGRVELADGHLTYDFAIVCLGADVAYYDLPGVEEHATPLRTVEHAHRVREEFLGLSAGARVVVGGAGLSGVQVVGELAALAREQAHEVDLVLVERLDAVAPGFHSDFRRAIREELDERGVEVRTGTAIERASADAIETDGGTLAYDQFVWTGGIRGRDPLGGDRPQVRSDLRLENGTFVAGDAARAIDRDGEVVPASAQAAIREAEIAATNVARLVEGGSDGFEPRLEHLSFTPRAWVVSVGDGAVARVGPTVLRGSAALAVKATAGVGYLTSVGAIERAVEVAREEFGG